MPPMRKSDLRYDLPPELIAQEPLPDRSASRLLVLDRVSGQVEDRVFSELPNLLNAGDLLVFNDTRVIRARLFGHKQSGGKVELLIERILSEWDALSHVRASKSPGAGAVIQLDGGYRVRVLGRENELFRLQFLDGARATEVLEAVGHVPLPPYIERPDAVQDETRYQTVFSRIPGAIAAPTAGLHFDRTTLDRLQARGIDRSYVTLHVGSGTFQPLRAEHLSEHRMHAEYCEVGPSVVAAVDAARERARRVVAVGTTSVRSLESAAISGCLSPFRGETRLFIQPGFSFRCVDALLTNFHLPESTLLALVCAFAGYEQTMSAYRHAVRERYRLFSYGDAMLIIDRSGRTEAAL
jgi:S-adenosylmethionine:tRNA ribosyltransferase-isomerase